MCQEVERISRQDLKSQLCKMAVKKPDVYMCDRLLHESDHEYTFSHLITFYPGVCEK